jgi:hypothetical protein
MDYTTYDRFMQALHSESSTLDPSPDKTLVDQLITAASRAFDRLCTGVPDAESDDYFQLETITNEILLGQISRYGQVFLYAHKPVVTAVSALSYRVRIKDAWTPIDLAEVYWTGPRIEAYPTGIAHFSTRCWVKATYTGGLAATTAALPADLQELVTLLAIRFYREAETGITDVIGVAELGTLVYTKAWPTRVEQGLVPFRRRVGWRHPA